MQKQEFEERIERTVTDEQYKVIEEVYMWHPSIRNTSGKDEVAELYKSFGMTIFHEAMTEEGELFYEDEEGDASYGWSLLDFMQGEYDDFTQMEIQQRIRSKMSKRDYIDAGSIQTTVNFDGHIYHIRIAFRRTDSNSEYNIDIESNGVEVIVE